MIIMVSVMSGFEFISRGFYVAFIGYGSLSNLKQYLKEGLLISLPLVIISLVIGGSTAEIAFLVITPLFASLLFNVFLIPIVEEQMFRGAFTPTLAQWVGILPSIAIAGLGFGIFHWYVFHQALIFMLFSILFGFVMSFWTLYKRQITSPLIAHILYNLILLVVAGASLQSFGVI